MNNFNLHELIFIDFLNAMNEEDLCHYIERYNSLDDIDNHDELWSSEYSPSSNFFNTYFSLLLKNQSESLYISSINNDYRFIKEIKQPTKLIIETSIKKNPIAYCLINKKFKNFSYFSLCFDNFDRILSTSISKLLNEINSRQQMELLNQYIISENWINLHENVKEFLIDKCLQLKNVSPYLDPYSLIKMAKHALPDQQELIRQHKNWKSDANLILDIFNTITIKGY